MDREKELWPIYLGPIQSKAQIPHLTALLTTHPFLARGVHGASKTGSNEPQRLSTHSRNNLSGGYTSHDFVTARAWYAITTALQPSTSIYRGLIVVPKLLTMAANSANYSYKVKFVSLNAMVWHLHLLLWVHPERNLYK